MSSSSVVVVVFSLNTIVMFMKKIIVSEAEILQEVSVVCIYDHQQSEVSMPQINVTQESEGSGVNILELSIFQSDKYVNKKLLVPKYSPLQRLLDTFQLRPCKDAFFTQLYLRFLFKT